MKTVYHRCYCIRFMAASLVFLGILLFASLSLLGSAQFELTKTVCSTPPCPGSATLTVDEGDTVIYCYEVENTGDAAALNVAVIDDNGTPGAPGDDFGISLTGLTDEDGDTFADDLAVGATASGNAAVTLNTPGSVTNTATGYGVDATSGGDITDTDSVTVTVNDRVATLVVYKTVCSTPPCPGSATLTVDEGDTVIYCYEVENTGDAAALNVAVIDDNGTPGTPGDDFGISLTGLTDEDGDTFADDLAVGATASGNAAVTLNTPGSVTNTTTAYGQDATSGGDITDTDSVTVTVNDRAAELQITKTVCSTPPCPGSATLTVDEGDTVIYCYEVENTGDAAALNVAVIDDNGTPGAPGDDFGISLTGLTDEDGDTFADDLAVGATASGNAAVTLNTPGSVTNTTTAYGQDATSGGDITDTDSVTVTVNDRAAELQITKTVCSTPPCPGSATLTVDEGDTVIYCYEVENTGDAAALNVAVIDDNGTPGAPGDDFGISLTGLTDEDGDTFADDLAVGATASGNAAVTLNTPGSVTNTATSYSVDATSGGDVTDTDSVTVTVNDRAAVPEVTKTVTTEAGSCPGASTLTVDEGDTVKYCYTLQNTGNAALLNVAMMDDSGTPGSAGDDFPVLLSGGLTDEDGDAIADDLAPGAATTGSVLVTLYSPGSVTNTATGAGWDATSLDLVEDTDSATVTVNDRVAELRITKTVFLVPDSCPGTATLTVDEGDTVQFCHKIENIGDAAALDVSIQDVHTIPGSPPVIVTMAGFSGLTDEDGDAFLDDLAPGASVMIEDHHFTITYDTPGIASNTATVTGVDATSSTLVSASDSATVTINDRVAELRITKTVFLVPGSCPGTETLTVDEDDTVQFCHKIENIGDAAALDVSIQDVHTIPGSPPVIVTMAGFSGLTDEDGDAFLDDLAPGASVMIEDHHFTITYNTPGTASNTAMVTGVDATSSTPVSASDTVTVEVTNIPPTLHDCPADIYVDNDAGLPSAVVDWTPPTATDPSGDPPTITSTHAAGDTFPAGSTTVTYTATDDHGGQTTCSFDVVVENTEPPVVTIVVPMEDDIYLVGEKVLARWTATSIVEIDSVQATASSGDPLDTSRADSFLFEVTATDVTGLTTTVEVPWHTVLLLRPAFDPGSWTEDWLCIDQFLPFEERILIGLVPLGGIYGVGDPVQIFFSLCDINERVARDRIVMLSLTRVNDPFSDIRFRDLLDYLLRFYTFHFDFERGGYFFELQTWGFAPGYYDLWIAVNSRLYERIRIQLVAP